VNRLDNEIAQGLFPAAHGAGEVWNWKNPAGGSLDVRAIK
jgi:hypothetical protein